MRKLDLLIGLMPVGIITYLDWNQLSQVLQEQGEVMKQLILSVALLVAISLVVPIHANATGKYPWIDYKCNFEDIPQSLVTKIQSDTNHYNAWMDRDPDAACDFRIGRSYEPVSFAYWSGVNNMFGTGLHIFVRKQFSNVWVLSPSRFKGDGWMKYDYICTLEDLPDGLAKAIAYNNILAWNNRSNWESCNVQGDRAKFWSSTVDVYTGTNYHHYTNTTYQRWEGYRRVSFKRWERSYTSW